MKRLAVAPVAILLGPIAVASASCGSSGSTKASSSSSSSTSEKATFCAANVTIDKASANVNSGAGFLAVLKANTAALDTLQKDAPSGKVGTEAKGLASFTKNAVATNNANALSSPPASLQSAGGDIDTYCGVDGEGNPLPSYFGQGKSTAFCSVQSQINAGTSSAQDAAGVLAFLKAHQSLVDQFSSDMTQLPSSLQPQAQTLVSAARSAIATNNPAPLNTQAIQTDGNNVGLYCGENH